MHWLTPSGGHAHGVASLDAERQKHQRTDRKDRTDGM